VAVADCAFDLSRLDYVLPLAGHYPVVCGAREEPAAPWRTRLERGGLGFLCRHLLGTPVRDSGSGLMVFWRPS